MLQCKFVLQEVLGEHNVFLVGKVINPLSDMRTNNWFVEGHGMYSYEEDEERNQVWNNTTWLCKIRIQEERLFLVETLKDDSYSRDIIKTLLRCLYQEIIILVSHWDSSTCQRIYFDQYYYKKKETPKKKSLWSRIKDAWHYWFFDGMEEDSIEDRNMMSNYSYQLSE